MKLVDLDPLWMTTADGRRGMGVTFECPCGCRGTERETRLGVFFANPLDGGPPAPPDIGPRPRWQRTGDSFETLTLTPSINASASGHWHGFITAGEMR